MTWPIVTNIRRTKRLLSITDAAKQEAARMEVDEEIRGRAHRPHTPKTD